LPNARVVLVALEHRGEPLVELARRRRRGGTRPRRAAQRLVDACRAALGLVEHERELDLGVALARPRTNGAPLAGRAARREHLFREQRLEQARLARGRGPAHDHHVERSLVA
jgi:hypothetical protein